MSPVFQRGRSPNEKAEVQGKSWVGKGESGVGADMSGRCLQAAVNHLPGRVGLLQRAAADGELLCKADD